MRLQEETRQGASNYSRNFNIFDDRKIHIDTIWCIEINFVQKNTVPESFPQNARYISAEIVKKISLFFLLTRSIISYLLCRFYYFCKYNLPRSPIASHCTWPSGNETETQINVMKLTGDSRGRMVHKKSHSCRSNVPMTYAL